MKNKKNQKKNTQMDKTREANSGMGDKKLGGPNRPAE